MRPRDYWLEGERVELTDLTPTLYFAAAVRVAVDGSMTRLLPLELQREPLSPHEYFSQRILFSLQALGMIEPEVPVTNPEDWLSTKRWIESGLRALAWRIRWTPKDCLDRTESANALLRGMEPSEGVLSALLGIWRELALAEVVQYASWTLAKSGCNPHWAERATSGMDEALRTFSISQVMHLIQLAMRSLASTHQRGGLAASRLGTVFADSLIYFSRRARLEKWTIRDAARPIELPISVITALFAEEVAQLNGDYSNRTPSKAALLEAMTKMRAGY